MRFSKKLFGFTLMLTVILAFGGLLIAQDGVGDDGIGDSYYPTMGNGGYDVLHYTIDLTADMRTGEIEATTTLDLTATQDLTQFNLDFTGLTIDQITIDGATTAFTREGRELVIVPMTPLEADTTYNVAVSYHGEPSQNGGWNYYGTGVMVAGEPFSASNWYPVNEHPLDKSTYTFLITVDDDFNVGANGTHEDTIDNGDGTMTYVFEARDPMASYLTTVGIGDFIVLTDESASGVPIRHYFASGLPDSTIADFDQTADMIDFFETVFGAYPFEVYGVIVHDIPLGFALETQTLSIFGNSFTGEGVASHELAHQWFGDSVSVADWQYIWLNEGFATYAEALWVEFEYGETAFENLMAQRYGDWINPTLSATKQEIIDFLSNMPLSSLSLTEEDAFTALNALLGNDLGEDRITTMIERISPDGIQGNELSEVIEDSLFIQADLSINGLYTFLITLGFDDVAEAFQTEFVATGDPLPENLFDSAVYDRGGLTLHALRLRIGDEAFFELLPAYTEQFHDGNASTADFIAMAEDISGQDLTDFFDAWLYNEQVPDIPEANLFFADF